MLKKLFAVSAEKSRANEVSMTIFRVFFGLTFALAHGMGKLPVNDKFIEGVNGMGLPFPEMFAWAAALSEFVGGLLVAFGLATRVGAFFLLITMAVAAFRVHVADPFQVKELAFVYLIIALVFLCRGGNNYSVDKYLKFKK